MNPREEKRMKKKILSALLSAAMVATLLVGCGSSAPEQAAAPAAEEAAPAEEEAAPAEEAGEETAAPAAEGAGDAEFTIALCAKTEGIAWFDDMRTGVDEFNADHDDVYAYEINPEGSDAAKQNAMLEDLIAQGVDAICCVPVDAQAVAATLQKARDAGIVVVTHEASDILDSVDYDLEAFDNDYFGTLYGQYLAEAMGGEGQYYAAVGGLGMTTHMQWFNSMVAYLEENHPDMELVNPNGTPGEDDNNEATAYDLAVQAIAAYPELKGLVDCAASSNGMALALEEQGRTDIKLVGLATPSQGGAYIKSGTQYRGLCWRPADAGYTACEIAYKILKGEEITESTSFTKEGYDKITIEGNLISGNAPLVFTPENVDDYPF